MLVELGKILLRRPDNPVERTKLTVYISFNLLVKVGSQACEVIDIALAKLTSVQYAVPLGFLCEGIHFYGVVDDLTCTIDLWVFWRPGNGNDTQIEIGGQSLIKPDFLFTKMFTFFQCREVEEPEVDGLLDFVDESTGKKYPRDMRFNQFYRYNSARKGMWLTQGLDIEMWCDLESAHVDYHTSALQYWHNDVCEDLPMIQVTRQNALVWSGQ